MRETVNKATFVDEVAVNSVRKYYEKALNKLDKNANELPSQSSFQPVDADLTLPERARQTNSSNGVDEKTEREDALEMAKKTVMAERKKQTAALQVSKPNSPSPLTNALGSTMLEAFRDTVNRIRKGDK